MRRILQLAAVGTAAGAFSGLFGVGGGIVIVPLLVLWLGYGEREAAGVALSNEVPERALELAFAGLILFIAAQLVRRALQGDEGEA